ncbi:MAG: hypothetical protein QW328_09785 [Nitrososphaerota archaeon]
MENLTDFLLNLCVVTHNHPFIKNKDLCDMGLIVMESARKEESVYESLTLISDAITKHTGKSPIVVISDGEYYADSLIEGLLRAFQQGSWLLVYIKSDPSPEVLRILKELSESNEFTYCERSTKEMTRIIQNSSSRVIVCIEEALLNTGVSYPYFSALFGLIFREGGYG